MKKKIVALGILSIALLGSCTTTDSITGQKKPSKTTVGTGIGAGVGAIVGQIIGKDTKGTVIGTAGGAAVGAVIGNIFDRQEAKLKEKLEGTGVEVERTGDGEIVLIANEKITFATNSYSLQPKFLSSLNSIASVLNEYKDSKIVVSGHTDSTGNDGINDPLSVNRADSVANYLAGRGVSAGRITSYGYGSRSPIASNSTVQGRSENRRVEIKIMGQEK